MTKELFVSSTPHETKVGLVEDDLLAEIYLERENEYTLAGSIYKGRVTRVLPGMQSAFVDIGLERDAFLYVSDFMELEEGEEVDDIPAGRPANGVSAERTERSGQDRRPVERTPDQFAGSEEFPTESRAEFNDDVKESQSDVAAEPGTRDANGAEREDRGGYRGRRRRRGRRGERPEQRFSRPTGDESREHARPERTESPSHNPRPERNDRASFGPPPGYQ